MIVIVSCLLVLACCFCSGVHAQTADTADFSHMQSALLPIVSGLTVPLSPLPSANYDEQLGITFTQNFASLAYNVTTTSQADSEGYGPAYLLNGLSNDNYWYQVGISYNWPNANGGYAQGFNFNYEVFNPAGKSVYPINSGGQKSFSGGTVNSGDLVLLDIYISNGVVSLSAKDWNTGAVAQAAYADNQTTSFIGLSSPSNNGFFTGLMTEWYHATPYSGDETQVTYSSGFGLSSAWMWMDEWEPSNPNWSGQWSTKTQVTYSSPTQLQSFASHGVTEYSSAYQFITGSIVQQMTSITLLPAGGSTPLSGTNEFAVSFTFDSLPQASYAQDGTLTLTVDNGSNVVISGVSTGSSSTEEWVLNSQGANVTVPAGSTSTFYYYDILSQQVAYEISGGGNPANPTLTYFTAPSAASAQFSQTTNTISLPQISPQTEMVLRGTSATVSNNISGLSQDRWATPTSSWSISQANQIPNLLIYYHQYQVTASYSTSDDSATSSSLILSGTQFGSNYQLVLTTSNQITWLDANTPWSIPAIVEATSGTEKWSSSVGTAGNIAGAITVNPSYVHQYYLAVISTYGSPSGSGWYESGSTAYANVASNIVSGGSGIQYVLTGWSGDSSGSGATSYGITMNTPKTATATWVTQYYLNVSSAYGTQSLESGWFNASSNINEDVTSSVPESIITEQVCTGWTGTGSAPATGTNTNLHFTINQPSSITWNWQSQIIYSTVSLIMGTPLITAIIGLSIYSAQE